MTRTLVTGAAGFIGSALLPELERHGHEVHALDDLSNGRRELAPVPDSRFFRVDLRDRAAVHDVVERVQPQQLVHLAAIHFIPDCNARPHESADINIRGTIHLLEAAAEVKGLERALFASTAAVYPIADEAVAETHPTAPLDIYGLSKLAGEHLMREFHLATGVPTINCRFFNAFGPNETNPHLIPEIQDQVNSGLREIELGNLEPKRDFIHTSDMARAARLLLESFDSGCEAFNLGRGIEYSVVEIVEAFSRQLGEEIRIKQDPSRMRKTDRLHLLADITKIQERTGWRPEIDLDEGIATLIRRPTDS